MLFVTEASRKLSKRKLKAAEMLLAGQVYNDHADLKKKIPRRL